jgi:uncharacterized protein (DUF2062 family)
MARKLFKRYTSSADAFLHSPLMRRISPRLDKLGLRHPNLWHLNRHSAAGGVAIGLATGLIPGPLQMLGALLLALVFRVNLPLALVTTFYSNPFTIVPLYLLAYILGGMLTGESVKDISVPDFDWNPAHLAETLREGVDWIASLGHTLAIGVAMEAMLFSRLGYFLVRTGWRILVIHEWRKRRERREPLGSRS